MTQTAALFEYGNSPENLQQSMKLKTMGKDIKTKQHNNTVSSLAQARLLVTVISESAE